MTATFNDLESGAPIRGSTSAVSLRESRTPSTPPRVSPSAREPGVLRGYVDATLGSRAWTAGPIAPLEVSWRVELDPGFPAQFILQSGPRIVVQEQGAWRLLDAKGAELRRFGRVGGDLLLDPEHGLLYSDDDNGFVRASSLADGSLSALVAAQFGSDYTRTVLRREKASLWVHSVQLPTVPTGEPPSVSLLEVQDLGNPIETDDVRFATSARLRVGAISRVRPLLVARSGERIVVAVPGQLLWLGPALTVEAAVQAEFEPLALSVDEEARAYMLVRSEGRDALWVVTSSGEQKLAANLQLGLGASPRPPVIGYDHRALVVGSDSVQLFDASEGPRWSWKAKGSVAGAVVTPTDGFVVAAGSEVVYLDREGTPRILSRIDGETLITPPTLTSDGRVLVASSRALYCLVRASAPAR